MNESGTTRGGRKKARPISKEELAEARRRGEEYRGVMAEFGDFVLTELRSFLSNCDFTGDQGRSDLVQKTNQLISQGTDLGVSPTDSRIIVNGTLAQLTTRRG